MKIGLQLPTWGVTAFSAQQCIALARRAEDCGFHSVWAGDHLIQSPQLRQLGGDGQLEVFTLLGAVAGATRAIQIGTCVVIPVRSAVHTWVAFATLGHLAPGRVIAGLGVGGFEPEFLALGLDFAGRGDSLEEVISLLDDWPAAESLHPALDGWSSPARPEQPLPVWLGTSSTTGRALERVARAAAGWFLTYPTPEEYRQASTRLDLLLTRAGRSATAVTRSALLRCCLSGGPDHKPERLLAAHDRALAELVGHGRGTKESRYGGSAWAPGDVRSRHLVGNPQAVTERLMQYRDAGMEHVVVSFIPAIDSFRSVDVFADQVLPALTSPQPEGEARSPHR